MGGLLVVIVASAVLFLFPAWRIFTRAGFAPMTALIVLIPGFGPLIAMAILTFVDWPASVDQAEDSR